MTVINLDRTHVDDVYLVVEDGLEGQALFRPERWPFDGLFLLRRRSRLSGGLCDFYRFWHIVSGDDVDLDFLMSRYVVYLYDRYNLRLIL